MVRRRMKKKRGKERESAGMEKSGGEIFVPLCVSLTPMYTWIYIFSGYMENRRGLERKD